MKQLGVLLVLFGVGSIVLNLLGREFVILLWIDNWGPTVGWAIRGGAAAIGAILFFLGWRAEQGGQAAEAPAARQEPTLQATPPGQPASDDATPPTPPPTQS